MNVDNQLYKLPFLGKIIKRLYSYFKKNILFADFIHFLLGLGIGFVIVGDKFLNWGITFLIVSVLGHIYAYIKGGKK